MTHIYLRNERVPWWCCGTGAAFPLQWSRGSVPGHRQVQLSRVRRRLWTGKKGTGRTSSQDKYCHESQVTLLLFKMNYCSFVVFFDDVMFFNLLSKVIYMLWDILYVGDSDLRRKLETNVFILLQKEYTPAVWPNSGFLFMSIHVSVV